MVLLILIDQLLKYIIRFSGGFYICNKGIAFGINLPGRLILTLIIVIIVLISLLSLKSKFEISNKSSDQNSKLKKLAFISNFKFSLSDLALALILSGALSNLLDRWHYGCVTDYIDLRIWPVFNLADILICLGAIILILGMDKSNR